MKNLAQVNQYLADLSVWNIKLHNLHFNVVGPQFKAIHEYLEAIYDVAFEYYDAVAEHAKMQGEFPVANVAKYLAVTSIEELGEAAVPQAEAVQILLADIKKMNETAVALRNSADEAGDFLLVGLLEEHIAYYVKQIWFTEASFNQ